MNFSRFQAVMHILRVNCTEMVGDEPIQPACEICAIEFRL